jgi:hypothetical protein
VLQPFLFIGVGGSGGKTLRVIREELAHRLETTPGWTGGFPTAWQFLHIDVPTVQDGLDPDLPGPLEPDCYVGLAGDGLGYDVLDAAVMSLARRNDDVLSSLVGWRPDPNAVRVPINKGAGQYRAIGRMVAAARLGQIGEEIGRKLGNLDNRCLPQLRDLSGLLGLDTDGEPDVQVVLVSSLAGGSGSGAFLDVADALRAHDPVLSDAALGIVFAPDIFADVPEALAPGVQPNTLAALAELQAAYENVDPGRDEVYALSQANGLTPGRSNRHGLARPFLVGASNGKAEFGNQNEMYRAAGKTLAALVTSQSVQQQIGPYIIATWPAASTYLPPTLGLNNSGQERGIMSALGFAALTLGRDRFTDYAAEFLAGAALERILRGHHDPSGRKRADELLAAATDEAAMEEFLRSCGLWELGTENNDVLDAIRPGGASSSFVDELKRLVGEIREAVAPAGRAAQGPAQWYTDIQEAVRERRGRYETANTGARVERAQAWVADIQDRIRDAVEAVIATKGASVAAALLNQLPEKIDQTVAELEQERQGKVQTSLRYDRAVKGEIEKFGEPMGPDNNLIAKAIESAAKALGQKAEGELREVAIELLGDLRDSVVKPLATAVADAAELLAQEETSKGEDGEGAISTTWPNEGVPLPEKYEPAQNEIYIEKPATFSTMFREQIRSTMKPTGGDLEVFGVAMSKATSQVITYVPDKKQADEQHLISFENRWIPKRMEYRTEGLPSSAAEFRVHLSLEWILKRSRAWVLRREDENTLGAFVRESLRDYVAANASRPKQVAGALQEAIDFSAPLVNIDTGVLARAHEGDSAPRYVSYFTEIPFPSGSEAADAVEKVIAGVKGLQNADIKFSAGDQQRIDIFTVLDRPLHPVVYKSLMSPIASQWDKEVAKKSVVEFWKQRRARPLPEYVPVSPATRRAMVKGWYVGRFLDLVEIDDDGRISVLWPEQQRWVPFPQPLLRSRVASVDNLAAALEALPLALLEFHTQPTDGTVLEPYRQLIALGDYDEIARSPLGRWVTKGSVESGAKAPGEGATPEDRLTEVMVTLDATWETIEEKVCGVQPHADERFFKLPLLWELREDVQTAFDELRADLDQLREEGLDDRRKGVKV